MSLHEAYTCGLTVGYNRGFNVASSHPGGYTGMIPEGRCAGPFDKSPSANTDTDPRQQYNRNSSTSPQPHMYAMNLPSAPPHANDGSTSTLYWGNLEPWMDTAYAERVVTMMNWRASVYVPQAGLNARYATVSTVSSVGVMS